MSAPATGGPIVTPSSYDSNAGQPPSGSAAVPLKHASQKAKEGAHEEALALIDGYLAPYGKQNVSVDAVQAAAVSVRLCNELALSCMRDSSSAALLDAAYAYLKWALRAPHASPALRAVTLNNAGIYYARTGQPQAALRCLERVGKQGGVVVEDDVSVHVTLNMTTVLADLGRHAEALEKAQEAVRTLTKAERAGKPADASLLSAAYHNLAVQQERLGSSKGHVRSYRAAVQQARKGGAKSQMASFMEQAYTHARQRAAAPAPAGARPPSSPGLGAKSRGATPSALPPVGSGSASAARHGGGSAPVYGQPRRANAAGRAAGGGSRGAMRSSGSLASTGGVHDASFVSLDDVYSGIAAAIAPVGSDPSRASLVPPPGVGDGGGGGGARHAPRSAGTARIGASKQ